MGRDLLGQDYILKQLTASLIYPEHDLGKKFWDEIYKRAKEKYGTTDIPVNTFNKVWIVPDTAAIVEYNGTAFVRKSHLKVMLEEDYVALSHNNSNLIDEDANPQDVNKVGSDVVREVLLPAIEKEVNEGQNFVNLRQIYSSMILATWFKIRLRKVFWARSMSIKIRPSSLMSKTKK